MNATMKRVLNQVNMDDSLDVDAEEFVSEFGEVPYRNPYFCACSECNHCRFADLDRMVCHGIPNVNVTFAAMENALFNNKELACPHFQSKSWEGFDTDWGSYMDYCPGHNDPDDPSSYESEGEDW